MRNYETQENVKQETVEVTEIPEAIVASDILGNEGAQSGSKTRVISCRVTAVQYDEILKKISDEYGGQRMTLAEFFRQSMLSQRVKKITEHPLDKYRLAIAAEIDAGLTAIVQVLDEIMDMSEERYDLVTLVEILQRLEVIQNMSEGFLSQHMIEG